MDPHSILIMLPLRAAANIHPQGAAALRQHAPRVVLRAGLKHSSLKLRFKCRAVSMPPPGGGARDPPPAPLNHAPRAPRPTGAKLNTCRRYSSGATPPREGVVLRTNVCKRHVEKSGFDPHFSREVGVRALLFASGLQTHFIWRCDGKRRPNEGRRLRLDK